MSRANIGGEVYQEVENPRDCREKEEQTQDGWIEDVQDDYEG